jgi:hypothetical protein
LHDCFCGFSNDWMTCVKHWVPLHWVGKLFFHSINIYNKLLGTKYCYGRQQ